MYDYMIRPSQVSCTKRCFFFSSCPYGYVGHVRPRYVWWTSTFSASIKSEKKNPLGIPRSFRMMQGFGVNTYTLTNADGKRVFVKFHMIPELGVHSLVWDEALKIGGQDPGTIWRFAR